jgi:hypothetical protein
MTSSLDHIFCRGSIVDVSWAVVQRSQGEFYLLGACRLTYHTNVQASSMEGIEPLL